MLVPYRRRVDFLDVLLFATDFLTAAFRPVDFRAAAFLPADFVEVDAFGAFVFRAAEALPVDFRATDPARLVDFAALDVRALDLPPGLMDMGSPAPERIVARDGEDTPTSPSSKSPTTNTRPVASAILFRVWILGSSSAFSHFETRPWEVPIAFAKAC